MREAVLPRPLRLFRARVQEHPATGAKIWIKSPAWDLFWIFPSIWLSLFLYAFDSWIWQLPASFLVFVGLERAAALVHSWSTTYLVIASPLFSSLRKANPRKYVAIPVMIFIFSLLLGIAVAAGQRFPETGKLHWGLWLFMLYIGSFFLGHFWHFGRQDFGVLSLYRNRAGQGGSLDRRVDLLYASFLMYLIQPIVYFRTLRSTAFSEIVIFLVPIPTPLLEKLAQAAVVITCLSAGAVIVFEFLKGRGSLPKLLYYAVMASHPILLFFGPKGYGLYYAAAYLWSHWFIASALAGRLHINYQVKKGFTMSRSRGIHLWRVGGIALAVWWVTRSFTRYHLLSLDNFEYKKILASLTPNEIWVAGVFMGIFLGEQLVHYYCDRCLFRF